MPRAEKYESANNLVQQHGRAWGVRGGVIKPIETATASLLGTIRYYIIV